MSLRAHVDAELVPGTALLASLLEDLGQDGGRDLLVVADVGHLVHDGNCDLPAAGVSGLASLCGLLGLPVGDVGLDPGAKFNRN